MIRAFLLIGAVSAILFFPTYHFALTYCDDAAIVLESAKGAATGPSYFVKVFTQPLFPSVNGGAFYRPLSAASFALNSLLRGTSLAMFRGTNIILHGIAAWLVFLLLVALGGERRTALILAVFFLVHPVSAETVAWLTARSESMLAVFCIAACIAFAGFIGTKRPLLYFLHLAFFAMALLTKETAAALIVILPAYLRLIAGRRFLSREGRAAYAGWILVVGLWLIARAAALKSAAPVAAGEMLRALAANAPEFFSYLGRIFFPFGLSVWPPFEARACLAGAVAAAFIVILLMRGRKGVRMNRVIFGALWFVLFLAPALARPAGASSEAFFYCRAYLPAVGILMIVQETGLMRSIDLSRPLHRGLLAAVFLVVALAALIHAYDYASSGRFWENARRTAPRAWREIRPPRSTAPVEHPVHIVFNRSG